MKTRQRSCACLLAAAGLAAVVGFAPPALATRAEVIGRASSVITSLGDLDNDKDLDLVTLSTKDGAIRAFLDGDTVHKQAHAEEGPADTMSMCLADVTSPANAGPDGFLDVVVLTSNKSADTHRIHVFVNLGRGSDGRWLGLKTGCSDDLASTLPGTGVAALYDSLWCGELFAGNGPDLFVYASGSGVYTAASNKGVSGGAWQGFEPEDVFQLSGETLSAIADQGGAGVSFVLLNAAEDVIIKKYRPGSGLE